MEDLLHVNARAVLEALRANPGHPTAQEIYETVRRARPRIGMATVYRILHQLVEQETIRVWDYGSACARYDAHMSRHDHALCTECGALLDIPIAIPLSQELLEQAAQASGLEMGSYEVRIYGRCRDCQTRSNL